MDDYVKSEKHDDRFQSLDSKETPLLIQSTYSCIKVIITDLITDLIKKLVSRECRVRTVRRRKYLM